MTAAYFEDHPTDPEKVILRKPPLDQGADYERGFIDGMQKQMQSSVDKAVNRMAQTQEPVQFKCTVIDDVHPNGIPLEQWTSPPQRTWVGLTIEEIASCCRESTTTQLSFAQELEAKLKEKNT
jgi:hypothetical protein